MNPIVLSIANVSRKKSAQSAMIIMAFGDVLISEVYAITTANSAREMNHAIKTGEMPEIVNYAPSGIARMICVFKRK